MEEYIAKKMAEAKIKNKNKNSSASNEAQRKLKQQQQKEESERKEKEESERKEKEESERKEKEESERKEKEETERKEKEETERKEKEETERKEKEETERKEKEETERKEKEETERKEKEQQQKKKEETQRKEKGKGDAIPEMVFIVPYRDRRQQRNFFVNQMKVVLEDIPSDKYEIFYIHQTDNRSFNRGAMKNIGFLMLKDRYPDNYKDICIIFNDVDTMPYKKNFLNYKTQHGVVKHFYGFKYALGGIVSITGGDFEKTKGYPNFWAWGYEDNALQKRVINNGLQIDRSNFYPIGDKNMIQIKDDIIKSVNRKEFDTFVNDIQMSTCLTIRNLEYSIDIETNFVNVINFETENPYDETHNKDYNITSGKKPFASKRRGKRMGI
jgi:hypothetical protein